MPKHQGFTINVNLVSKEDGGDKSLERRKEIRLEDVEKNRIYKIPRK